MKLLNDKVRITDTHYLKEKCDLGQIIIDKSGEYHKHKPEMLTFKFSKLRTAQIRNHISYQSFVKISDFNKRKSLIGKY